MQEESKNRNEENGRIAGKGNKNMKVKHPREDANEI